MQRAQSPSGMKAEEPRDSLALRELLKAESALRRGGGERLRRTGLPGCRRCSRAEGREAERGRLPSS